MFKQLIRWLTPRSSKRRPASRRRSIFRLELLEDRCTPSTSTSFVGGTLALNVNTGDSVTITEAKSGASFTFAVSDTTNPTIGGAGAGPFANVKNISVDISHTGAVILVVGFLDEGVQQSAGIPGNFTVKDTQPNNAIAVEVHDGFRVDGAVSISNTGAGSTFLHHTSTTGNGTQDVTGVFLDPNNQAVYGSVTIKGSGSVGWDGTTVAGNIDVNLGNAEGSSCFAGKEFVFGQDPDAPPWQNFRFAANEIGGNVTIKGSSDTELYQSHVHGSVSITEGVPTSVKPDDFVQLGGDVIGKNFTVRPPRGGGETSGVFVDFSSIGGHTLIDQGSGGTNVIGVQFSFFHGMTTLTQGSGTNYLYIDSNTDLQSAATANSLPTDQPYLTQLQNAGLLPPVAGSTFNGRVKGTQGTSKDLAEKDVLEIGQDNAGQLTGAIVVFTTGSTFKAINNMSGSATVSSDGIHPTITGYP